MSFWGKASADKVGMPRERTPDDTRRSGATRAGSSEDTGEAKEASFGEGSRLGSRLDSGESRSYPAECATEDAILLSSGGSGSDVLLCASIRRAPPALRPSSPSPAPPARWTRFLPVRAPP
ncbi:hypothetical protein KM043_007289 [Ampulex compressa]|nr:hypothetical protein KM043_007289 [Ampulex compressa]